MTDELPLTRSVANAATGDRITFLASPMLGDGETLVFRCTLPPRADGAPLHCHADMHERFEVEAGALLIDLGDGERRILGPGDAIDLPAGTVHGFRNPIDRETVFRNVSSPGLELEGFLRMVYANGLAAPAGQK